MKVWWERLWDLYCHFLFILMFAAFSSFHTKHISFGRFLGSSFHLWLGGFFLRFCCFVCCHLLSCFRIELCRANNTADLWKSSHIHTMKHLFFSSTEVEIHCRCWLFARFYLCDVFLGSEKWNGDSFYDGIFYRVHWFLFVICFTVLHCIQHVQHNYCMLFSVFIICTKFKEFYFKRNSVGYFGLSFFCIFIGIVAKKHKHCLMLFWLTNEKKITIITAFNHGKKNTYFFSSS